MKNVLLSTALLLLLIACQTDQPIGPSDLLYRRWRMTQIQYSGNQPIYVPTDSQWSIVSFKQNGMILYGKDGKFDPCCSPARFKRKGNTLDLVDVEGIPLPERTPNPICISASCVAPGNTWRINRLTDSSLIISQESAIAVYEPYP
ncbi:hypothetical protein [Spirosoma foliorum]|uniref:Lipoprotein n=1 Tax=Spirosoma foliorum TaxID=2710596 RepID=A0A7G5GQT6_9BACT|nr:hypothetical protein [Spirosoma foliorum]QMW01228.1 hypothetical protein H3H32_25105 [Spirosoma foliorum]